MRAEKPTPSEDSAGERDPLRSKIAILRGRIKELSEELKAVPRPSKEREERKRAIRVLEWELAAALERNISRLEEELSDLYFLPATERVTDKTAALEMERVDNQADLDILRRIVTSRKAEAIGKRHTGKLVIKPTSTGCMAAAHTALEEFLPEGEGEALRSLKLDRIDRVWETLEKTGRAGEKVTVKFKYDFDKTVLDPEPKGSWITSPEETVLGMIKPEFLGWYFFGLAVAGGYHSVVLAVDNSEGGAPKIYWMDQTKGRKGFRFLVTGKLDKVLKRYHEHDKPGLGGWNKTRIWPLIPAPDTVIEMP
jgi:hypothetical protein